MRRNSLHSGYAAVVGLLAVLLTAGTAQASFVETVVENGPNVVVTGSGSIHVFGLGITNHNTINSFVEANVASILTGASGGEIDDWAGVYFTGPSTFGTGFYREPDSASGDLVGIGSGDHLLLPHGYDYLSAAALSNTATYDNQTFVTLGLTPGNYTWTWRDDFNDSDSFTLQIVAAAVPEPPALTMFLTMLGLVAVTAGVLRRRDKTA